MAPREQLEQLKRFHEYERWRGRNRLPENLFVWRLLLEGSELPGWRTRRVQPITAPRMPRSTHSIWQRREGDPDALLRIDVYECDSRDDAQFLLRLLGEIETPLVQLRDELEVGDVAFADPQDAVIFARANLAVRVANAGRSVIPVRAVAEQLDGHVSAKPVEIDEPETAGWFGRRRGGGAQPKREPRFRSRCRWMLLTTSSSKSSSRQPASSVVEAESSSTKRLSPASRR